MTQKRLQIGLHSSREHFSTLHASETFPRLMLLSYFLSGRLPLVCEQALPELCDARLRLQHHEAMTLAVETAEFCAFVLTRLRQCLVDDLKAFHHLLDVLKPGVMQDVDQAERCQRSPAE
jgi:hypothetical protein